jgi:hypothetical protein
VGVLNCCCNAVPGRTDCSGWAILSHSGNPHLARNTHNLVEMNRTDICSPWLLVSIGLPDLKANKLKPSSTNYTDLEEKKHSDIFCLSFALYIYAFMQGLLVFIVMGLAKQQVR